MEFIDTSSFEESIRVYALRLLTFWLSLELTNKSVYLDNLHGSSYIIMVYFNSSVNMRHV